MNKMDDYYKKQLTNFDSAEDGWNIPSEDLWNNAKNQFPKPKKKRRFLFLLFPIGLILCFFTYFFFTSSNVAESSNTLLFTEATNSNSNNKDEITKSKEINYIEDISSISANSVAQLENNPSPIQNKNEVKTGANNVNNKNSIRNKSLNRVKHIQDIKDPVKNTSLSFTNTENSRNIIENIIPSIFNQTDKSILKEDQPKKETFFSSRIESLMLQAINSKDVSKAEIELKNLEAIPINMELLTPRSFPNHEIGIGSTMYLLSLLGELKSDTNEEWPEEEMYFISKNNKNLNLHYSYLFSPKWSISTGAYFNNMNINFYGQTFTKLTESTISGHITTSLDDVNGGFVNLRQDDDFKIELIEGKSVESGDILKIDLDVAVEFNSIQLPLLINRSWNIKRTELFVGLGGAVNFESWKQKNATIELYNNANELITKPYSEGEQKPEQKISGVFLVQSGINYKFAKQFKVGIAGRLFMPQLLQTGLELRLLYSL